MPTGSTLTEQLAVLGVHLPAWPEEPEEPEQSGDWIKRGRTYAEGVRQWRAQLRNAPESTKAVVDQLLRHLGSAQHLPPWDRWLASVVHPDVLDAVILDRWEGSIEQIQTSPLSAAQLLGGSLALAEAHQLAGATHGIKRLLGDHSLTGETSLEICSQFLAAANTRWRMEEGNHCSEALRNTLAIHHEWCCLMKTAANWALGSQAETEEANRSAIVQSLERTLVSIGREDKWCLLPRSEAMLLLSKGKQDAAIKLLESIQPIGLAAVKREGYARLFASQLLASAGNWQQADALHKKAVASLEANEQNSSSQRAKVEILRTETGLLSHELSIALKNGSLSTAQPADASHEQQTEDPIRARWRSLSRSQLGQDLWVLEQLGWKQGGFFVEFGATDGVLLSNSWILEKHFGWKGICAEPNPKLFERLQLNRSCTLSQACVYRTSGKTMSFVLADAYGGLEDLGRDDQHVSKREAYAAAGHTIQVKTTSLLDLLRQNDAPPVIDYLSIDTEGSELAILEGFDWRSYQIRCITVEHNFTQQRESIRGLLEAKGYERREAKWDDWYFIMI